MAIVEVYLTDHFLIVESLESDGTEIEEKWSLANGKRVSLIEIPPTPIADAVVAEAETEIDHLGWADCSENDWLFDSPE